jgi:hypothetical protein
MNITIYWWNLGNKTLDFKGDINDFVKNKGFKVTKIKHPIHKEINGFRIKIYTSVKFTLDVFDNLDNALSLAVRTYLNYLGDKTIFTDSQGRTFKINWW